MPRRDRILPVLAAAGLLAAGCEFLDNLTEDKIPEAAPLRLVVRDDWTGDSLPRATCKADRGGLSASADLEGRIAFAEVPTGTYSVVCGANSYFDRKATVQVKAGAGGSAEVRLARKPGAEWYPGQEDRRFWISVDWLNKQNFIVPGRFIVSAYPRDDRKTFEYRFSAWPLERSGLPVTVDEADWQVETLSLPQEIHHDTIGVTVFAHLGDTVYVVGSDYFAVPLKRNKPPILHVNFDADADTIRLCNDFIKVGLEVYDLEGSCSVRLRNDYQFSPLPLIDTIVPCKDTVYTFKLDNRQPIGGVARPRPNKLEIMAIDDRDAVTADTITFSTLPNHPPEVLEFKAMTAPASAVAGAALSFRASLRDIDNAVDNTWVDWGDSREELVYAFTGVGENELNLSLTHAYSTPGTYKATLKTRNPCGDKDITADLDVVVNPPP